MARVRQKRRERIPFGGMKQKLSLDEATKKRLDEQGLVPRWINDENHGNRIQEALAGDYNFVKPIGTEEVGDKKEVQERDRSIRKLVGTHKDGSPKYAYLMAIKKKYYEEDQAAKEERNKLVDKAIMGGNAPGTQDHGVNPSQGGTKIKDVNYNP